MRKNRKVSRRDFIKLTALAGMSVLGARLAPGLLKAESPAGQTTPNIIVFVFDAMSARNLSLYGYSRRTTPNLEEFARRSTVFHAHHSSGNFTPPGTASLLTGTYPWTHRVFQGGGLIKRQLVQQNLFHILGSRYTRLAFSQNLWPNYFFEQFKGAIDQVLHPGTFSIAEHLVGPVFQGDLLASYRATDEFFLAKERVRSWPSLVWGPLDRMLLEREMAHLDGNEYPYGFPRVSNASIVFRLDKLFDGLGSILSGRPDSHLFYFHLMVPHGPYHPTQAFNQLFLKDHVKFNPKPAHRFGEGIARQKLDKARAQYDGYVANLDAEFGRLVELLEAQGILQNSYMIVTSDHGEMFERGLIGHSTRMLFEPVTHIPLIISSPGQASRKDVFSVTNNVDILPTLAGIAGSATSFEAEGRLLPGFGGEADGGRSTFVVEAGSNSAFTAIRKATIAMYKSNYKLIHYMGYESEDSYDLFDLDADREELRNLYPQSPGYLRQMKEELMEKVYEVNRPYL